LTTYAYDVTGRQVAVSINGVTSALGVDISGRVTSVTNGLGIINYTYDGDTLRTASESLPNGQIGAMIYGSNTQDDLLQQVTYSVGANVVSQYIYGHDVAAERIGSWSQQFGAGTASVFSFAYDANNQLTGAVVTQEDLTNGIYSYNYDPAGNRVSEQTPVSAQQAAYNALNEFTSLTGNAAGTPIYQWDGEQRLVSVTLGNTNTQIIYDGLGRWVSIQVFTNGVLANNRGYIWDENRPAAECAADGAITKYYYPQGFSLASGPVTGNVYYTHDHLSSIREVTDSTGAVRAHYAYDPFGRRTHLSGDLESDFGFGGMFFISSAAVNLTRYRAYDANTGRWLSRDPLKQAELLQGVNLFAYVRNNPVNVRDPLGLCCQGAQAALDQAIEDAEKELDIAENNPVSSGCSPGGFSGSTAGGTAGGLASGYVFGKLAGAAGGAAVGNGIGIVCGVASNFQLGLALDAFWQVYNAKNAYESCMSSQ
jgi:RHS repeat-associated protein